MNRDIFVEKLQAALKGTGMKLMSDEEFDTWYKEHQEYHQSPEALAGAVIAEHQLDLYLEEAKYQFTPEMGEISGFGGGYENACRAMLNAGLVWLDENSDADPQFKGYKGVYGILNEDNEDAEALSKAVLEPTDDATGAIHQAVVSSCLWIKKNGWEKYKETMSK